MSALFFSLGAALCAALSSLFFRKNADRQTSSEYSPTGYLVLFYFIAFVASIALYPDSLKFNVNWIILSIGCLVGFLTSTMMLLTAQALKQGPAGLTFAFQNASAIFPGLILFLLLGSEFGYSCSLIQLIGMVLVLAGLFIGTSSGPGKASLSWLKYALAAALVQILCLTFVQARCILFDCTCCTKLGLFSNFIITEKDDIWFMPGLFGASCLMQSLVFLSEKRKFLPSEIFFGSLGGLANFSSTFLLLLSTKFALPFEKGILFPTFAVGSIILCNVWANRLYKERFNFRTTLLCSLGIFMAVSG